MLDVLRHGFKFYGRKLDCANFRPAHALNPDILAKYAQNRLQVTRQVHFAPARHADEDQSVDLMLSLNGLPIATAELKNPLTRQTVHHAVTQYRARDAQASALSLQADGRRRLADWAPWMSPAAQMIIASSWDQP